MDPVSDTRASIWIFTATVRDQEVEGSNPFAPTTFPFVQPEDILYRTFLKHPLHLSAKRVLQRLQSLLLKIDVTPRSGYVY